MGSALAEGIALGLTAVGEGSASSVIVVMLPRGGSIGAALAVAVSVTVGRGGAVGEALVDDGVGANELGEGEAVGDPLVEATIVESAEVLSS